MTEQETTAPQGNDRELCVCGHEYHLHGLEDDGTRGLCIRDEWCRCPGFQPQHEDEEIPPSPALAELWGAWADWTMEQIGDE
jgi:hypothetical protein